MWDTRLFECDCLYVPATQLSRRPGLLWSRRDRHYLLALRLRPRSPIRGDDAGADANGLCRVAPDDHAYAEVGRDWTRLHVSHRASVDRLLERRSLRACAAVRPAPLHLPIGRPYLPIALYDQAYTLYGVERHSCLHKLTRLYVRHADRRFVRRQRVAERKLHQRHRAQ